MKEQLFRKVLCKDRLPDSTGDYQTQNGELYFVKDCNQWHDYEIPAQPEWWLEPVGDIGWISVKDRLPVVFTCDDFPHSISNDILMVDDKGETAIGNYITFKDGASPCFSPHGDDPINSHKIVYWMPFTQPHKPNTK